MPLSITLELNKTEWAVGEDPVLTLVLDWSEPAPQIVQAPKSGSGMPRFRLVDLASGNERMIRVPPAMPGIMSRLQLARGKPSRTFHMLSEFVKIETPGKYALSAIYEWDNGKQTAESAPLVVTVSGMGVRSMAINNPTYRFGSLAFVNPVADPADLMLADLVIEPEGGVRRIRPVAKVPVLTVPVVSCPPNQTPTMGQWVAWVEGETVKFVHVGDTLGPTAPGAYKIRGGASVVAPLMAGVNRSNLARGPGGAVLMRPDMGGGAELIVLVLDAEKDRVRATEVSRARMDRAPRWTGVLVRSDPSDRRLAFVTEVAGLVTVYDAPLAKQGETALRTTQVAQWKGDFVAAGATMSHDDVIRGCVLAWMGPPDERSLEVLSWSIAPGQQPMAEPMGALQWPHTTPIQDITLRLRSTGRPAVLLRSAQGIWHVIDGMGFDADVFEPFRETALPIDLAFLNDTEAVLVLAQISGGIVIKRLDGSDLPPKQR